MTQTADTQQNHEALEKLPPQSYFEEQAVLAKLSPIADQLVELVQQVQAPAPATQRIIQIAESGQVSDAQIDAVFDRLPNGANGFLKNWGYRNFAREILSLYATPEAAAELQALRDVYEQARGVLRYDGIDTQRAIKYRDGLIEAIEEVKTIDGGTWEPAPVLAAPAAMAALQLEPKPAFYTAIAEVDGDWLPLPEYSSQTSDGVLQRVLERAREEGYQGGNALERLKELGWAYRPVYFAVDPAQVLPLPLLMRDIARDLGISAVEACQSIKDLGNFSVNTAVTAEMALKLRELFPAPQAAPAAAPAGWKLVPVEPTSEMNLAMHNAARNSKATTWEIDAYKAALAAAPAAQAVEPTGLLTVDEYQAKYLHIHKMSDDERYGYESLYNEIVSGLQIPITAPQAQAAARDAEIESAVLAERERICAAIKAEDDHCVTQGDYMLDSDDCIKVARGEWERPVYDAAIAAAKGE